MACEGKGVPNRFLCDGDGKWGFFIQMAKAKPKT